ncbi:MAG TPA: 50S ribosomal protein L25/general stress protein Ctc [Bacteroidaceae bacterium]|nr:50S ribosomal protein L25/general stress protein Ctc [Bacteroidaceae bacterium]
MKSIEIKGEPRSEFGKKYAKQLRKNKLIPCILYGVDKDESGLPLATPFMVKADEVRNLIYTPDIFIVNLSIGKEKKLAVLKEVQFHPVKDNILHMDFYQVTDKKPIIMDVPIKLTGLAAGVKAGGKLTQALRRIKINALYTDIPEFISLDVTNMDIGSVIKVGDLSFNNFEFANPKNTVICSVATARVVLSVEEEEVEEEKEIEEEEKEEHTDS